MGIPERDVCAEVLPSHKKEKITSFQRGNVKVHKINPHSDSSESVFTGTSDDSLLLFPRLPWSEMASMTVPLWLKLMLE